MYGIPEADGRDDPSGSISMEGFEAGVSLPAVRMLRVTENGLPPGPAAIETERLSLRALTAELIGLAVEDRGQFLSRLQLATADAWLDAEKIETLAFFLGRLTPAIEATERYFVVVEAATHRAIGDLVLRLSPVAFRTCEIGYFIVPDRRGWGYATEAARGLLSWAVEVADMTCVEIRCDRENEASQRIAVKLGMTLRGYSGNELLWQVERSCAR